MRGGKRTERVKAPKKKLEKKKLGRERVKRGVIKRVSYPNQRWRQASLEILGAPSKKGVQQKSGNACRSGERLGRGGVGGKGKGVYTKEPT